MPWIKLQIEPSHALSCTPSPCQMHSVHSLQPDALQMFSSIADCTSGLKGCPSTESQDLPPPELLHIPAHAHLHSHSFHPPPLHFCCYFMRLTHPYSDKVFLQTRLEKILLTQSIKLTCPWSMWFSHAFLTFMWESHALLKIEGQMSI
jgi:hypothetical protein